MKKIDSQKKGAEKEIRVIDATDMRIGRVATSAATILMGKDTPSYSRSSLPRVGVSIINAKLAFISDAKKDAKKYKRYSGYPGGLKEAKMAQIIAKKGYSEIFRKAVYGMLPNNRLRSIMMSRLSISE